MESSRHGWLKDPLIAGALFLLACWQFLGAVDDRPMHRDEARWIHRAVYIRELAHPMSDYWDENTWIERGGTLDERYRLRAQPPMGSYLMGFGFLLQGQELPAIGFWNMDYDDAWNVERGNQPSSVEMTTARRTSAIVGAITVVATYFIANRLTNRPGGVVAGVFLAFHPLMIYIATFAGSDAVLTLIVALAAIAAWRYADRPSWPRVMVLGVILGLGASTKLSPLGVAVPLALLGIFAIALAVVMTLRGSTSPVSARTGLQLLSTPVVAVITLVASYPYLWRDPAGHIRALFDYRTWGMEIQGTLWEGVGVETREEALERVGNRLGDEWTTLGRLSGWTQDQFGWVVNAHGIELALAASGLVVLLWLVVQRGLWSGHALVAAVLTGQVAITIYGMRVDWARYHVPILLLVVVCIGVVAGQTWTALQGLWTAHLGDAVPDTLLSTDEAGMLSSTSSD